jgi:N-acetyltransferase
MANDPDSSQFMPRVPEGHRNINLRPPSSVMTFDLQPVLRGELLELRPLKPDDFDVLFAVASDPLIWEQHPEPDRCTEPVFRRYFQGALDSGGGFLVTDVRDGRVIGSTRYHGHDPARREVEIGWTFLDRAYWGGRYNTEMKRLLLDHAFRFVDRVVLYAGARNLRSQRAIGKIGGVRAGTRVDDPATGKESYRFVVTRPGPHATICWRRLDLPGHEVAELTVLAGGWQLSGAAALAHDGRPCRMEYDIECDTAWRTTRLQLRGHVAGAPVALDLARTDDDDWSLDGDAVPALRGCIDVDLGFSPSTNLLPIRRLNLAVGAHADVRAAWVRFPALTVEVLEQAYTRLDVSSYRYESAGGRFRRDLTVNADGLVLEYPDFWSAEASLSPIVHRR